jgi:hypothetical protein
MIASLKCWSIILSCPSRRLRSSAHFGAKLDLVFAERPSVDRIENDDPRRPALLFDEERYVGDLRHVLCLDDAPEIGGGSATRSSEP